MNEKLGLAFMDRITGFQGICIGFVQYISGCNQMLLGPTVDKEGKLRESQWFDEQRCQGIACKRIVLDNAQTPGFDKAAPKR